MIAMSTVRDDQQKVSTEPEEQEQNQTRNTDPRFKDLGQVVRKIRIEKGLTQGQVAEALQVTPGYISNVENGRTSMSLKILVYYAELTSTSLDSLVGITREDYLPIALDNDIMDAISMLPLETKKKLLKTIRLWTKQKK